MRNMRMVVVALAVAVTPVAAQQASAQTQDAQRREMQQKMRELEQQMRELQREMARLEPETPRAAVRARMPMVQVWGNRAYLGIRVKTQPKNPATDSVGAVLEGVTPGGAADEAGLKAGDIITSFNGDKLTGRYPAAGDYESEPGRKLVDFAQELDDGDSVVVDYRRGKETHRATIVARQLDAGSWAFAFTTPMPDMPKIEIEPPDIEAAIKDAMPVLALSGRWLDLEFVTLNPELGEYFGTTEGLLVIRAPEGSDLQLKSGDVILAADGRKPTNQAQLMRILRSYSPGEEVKLDIMRQKRRMTLAVKIPERRVRRDGYNYDFDWNRQ